jgi:cyanophycin synthetase
VRLVDSRRLFGPNVQLAAPAALVDVAWEDGEDPAAAVARWERTVRAILPGARTAVRPYAGGAALAIAGELDELLALCDVNEWAAEFAGATPPTGELAAGVAAARDPGLRRLAAEARRRDLPLLVDDEQVSIGLGRRSLAFPRDALPAPDAVPWDALGRVPVGLVTGTNGKTTSARLAGRMAELDGIATGVASTEGVTLLGAVIAAGDYTGPDAARLVLRHPEVELAILETARGGILRRGLAVDGVDAALITNVADDHLGRYGVDDVATMVLVKAVVGHAVRPGGRVVLNGDDPHLATLTFSAPVTRFSLRAGACEWSIAGGAVAHRGRPLVPIEEIPIAFGGAAPYNVANALGAAALASALGVSDEAIARGLRAFTAEDNPGRGNVLDVGGVKVVLDFAHNPEGVRAFLALAAGLRAPGARLLVVTAQPGDRRDEAIAAVAREVAAAAPARVVLHDLGGYLRGRAPGEVPALLRAELERARVQPLEPIVIDEAPAEAAALERALGAARPGDLVVLFPLLDPPGVRAVIAAHTRVTLDG